MKTHSHYTTPIAAAPRMRRGARVLAALLVLTAVSFALIYALRLSFNPTQGSPVAPARPAPIGSCRACQDEWHGAMQQSRVTFAPASAGSELSRAVPAAALSARRQPVASRIFRDELLGADQANLGSIMLPGGVVFESQPDQLRKSGPR